MFGGLTQTKIADKDGQLIDNNNPLPVSVYPSSTDLEGGGKISVGTTPVEITFTGTTKTIIITADKDNTGILYIGKSNVDSSGNNAITYLEHRDSITIEYDDSDNALYIVSSIASQNFWKGALI